MHDRSKGRGARRERTGPLARAGVLLGLAVLGACAPEPAAPSTAGVALVQRLVPTGAELRSGQRLVADIPAGETWETLSGTGQLGPSKRFGEGPFLRLRGEESLVRIPLDASQRAFNRVEVDLYTRAKRSTLALRATHGDVTVFESLQPLHAKDEIQRVTLHAPFWIGARPEVEALELTLRGSPRTTLARVELVDEEWTSLLPSVPEPYSIGGRTHPALGLTTAGPLSVEADVPVDGVLHVAAGVPTLLRWPDREVELVVTIGAGDEEVAHRLALPTTGDPAWADLRIELGERSGERVAFRFELSTADGGQAFAVLAAPLLLGRRNDPATVTLISSDTHRYDHLAGADGADGTRIETPTLDALGAGGVFFESCTTATNVTIPSHASLLTGVHVRDTGLVNNFMALSDAAPTLAERFRDAGFATLAVVSSAHLGHDRSGFGQGFDWMEAPPITEFRAEETVDLVRTLLERTDGVPTFLWIHLFDAHTPYEPPADFERLYWPGDRDAYDPSMPLPEEWKRLSYDPELRDLDLARARYRAEVTYLDRTLGPLLGEGRLARGTVLFTADHGESLGEHAIYWDHAGLYPASIHVPMILRGPGVPSGVRASGPVRQIDAGRTLLDLAGLKDVEFPGRNLLDALDATPAAAARPRFAISAHAYEASIQRGPWLLVLGLRPYRVNPDYGRDNHAVELYDLVADPDCTKDLAGLEHTTAAALRAELIDWLCAAEPTGWDEAVADDDATLQRLAELGYTDSDEGLEGDGRSWFERGCACEQCAKWE